MKRRRLRVPIFWKILASCLVLAGLVIVGSYFYTDHKMHANRRPPQMDGFYARYRAYQETVGQAAATVARVLGEDPELRAALAPGAPEGSGKAAQEIAERMWKALSHKNSLRPDVLVVFDANFQPVFLSPDSPIRAGDLRELEAVSRVQRGGSYFNELLVHGERALQVNAAPIAGPDGATVGGVVIGVNLERYFGDHMRASSKDEARQHRMLLVRNGEVVASTWDRKRWPELADATAAPVVEGKGAEKSTTLRFEDKDGDRWNAHQEQVSGFAGAGYVSPLGTIWLMRTQRAEPEASIPVLVILAGIATALAVAFVLAFWITRPVKKFVAATAAIAEGSGDLTRRIDVDSNDELGDLSANLNKLFDNLYQLAHGVQAASFQVGASSAQISAASKQMLEGVKDQAVKIEGSTAAVTELSSSIQQVASNAIEATKVAQRSNEAVSSAQESMTQIRRTVDEAADRIQELGESSKRIGNIVEVIRQISEQTSLLALNASIEAAHAGEQGRGFAVVADEVSSLARRVGQSAKDIEDLIATIKEQTADAVRAMQAGTREVESGTGMVTGTLANLKQIIEVVQDTANAVQEQAIVSDEIARNMDAVQKIANEVLASSEEAVIQGEQLHGLAYQLEESVRGFNLESGERPVAPQRARADGRRELPPRADGAADRKAAAGGVKPGG
jgi:methyl-accepting chemotaxis protein